MEVVRLVGILWRRIGVLFAAKLLQLHGLMTMDLK